jgi:hypothetical protein
VGSRNRRGPARRARRRVVACAARPHASRGTP